MNKISKILKKYKIIKKTSKIRKKLSVKARLINFINFFEYFIRQR